MTDKKSEYNVLLPIWDKGDTWFKFPKGQRGRFVGNNPWRISPSDKKQPVHEQARTFGSVVNVYKNAIAVGGPVGTNEVRYMGILMTMVSMLFFFPGFDYVGGPPVWLGVRTTFGVAYFGYVFFFFFCATVFF